MLFANVQLKIAGVFDVAMISVIIAFFVNLFDTAGTLLGVTSRSGLIGSHGNLQNIDRVLKADSSASKVERSPSMGSYNPFDVLKHSRHWIHCKSFIDPCGKHCIILSLSQNHKYIFHKASKALP